MEGGDICVEVSAVFSSTASLRGAEVGVETIDGEREDATEGARGDLEEEEEGGEGKLEAISDVLL